MAWNTNLVGPALEIASSERSPLRVLAGPGTGKTFALMRRVSRLLEQGADPEKILLVTFTRVSANDLQREIGLLNVQGADAIEKGTLHSFCFSLLSDVGVLEITGRTPRPLMLYETKFLIEDLSDLNLGTVYERQRRLKAFEAAWATEQNLQPGWPNDATDRRFNDSLLSWLRFHKAMLIGELVPIALDYLRLNPQSEYRSFYEHVLIDEYQDLNPAEQSLIDLFSEQGTLTVIGDADQSIYEHLRFAHPEGIISFPVTHADTYDVPMQECRRCPRSIVEMATSLIRNNQNRLANINLVPSDQNPDGRVSIVQWATMEDEANGLADYIAYKIASGDFEAGKTLVLSPRRQLGYLLRDALQIRKIPAHSYFAEEMLDGNPKDLADSHSQQAFTLLNLITDPEDRVSLRCWLGFGNNNLARKQYARLRAYCNDNNVAPRDALGAMVRGEINLRHTQYLVQRYEVLEQRLRDMADLSALQVFEILFPPDRDWASRFRLVIENNENEDITAAELLQLLRVNIIQPEMPTDVDYIRIMSPQKSKGLTADNVIVSSCIEGLTPTTRDIPDQRERDRQIEEQRRLFYVAITRARSELVLSSFAIIPSGMAFSIGAIAGGVQDQMVATITSRFIRELGPTAPAPVRGAEFLAGNED